MILCVMVGLSLLASAIGMYLGLVYGWNEPRLFMVAGGVVTAGTWVWLVRVDRP